MARQTKQRAKHDPADGGAQADPPTQEPKRRPTVEELMALSPKDFDEWRRSIGLKSASDLGIRVE